MNTAISFDPLAERKIGPLNFDRSPQESVACHVLRPAENVRMKALSVCDPDELITPSERAQFAESLRPHPEVSVLRLRNARVSGTGLVLTETGHLLRESNLRHPHIKSVTETAGVLADAPVEPVMTLQDAPVVSLNGVWPVHYGHFTYDNFSRLGLAQEALGFRPYSILTGYRNRGQHWCKPGSTASKLLEYAGVGMGQIHRLADHEWASVTDLVVVSPLNNFRPPAETIYAQKEMFSFLARISRKSLARGKGPRIYCSRRDTPNRTMENEAELVDALSRHLGFREIMLGEHSVEEQIAIFRDAKIAVGPIGNAFMNMAYMKTDARIAVFLPSQTWHFLPYYQSFATAGGFDINAMIARTTHDAGNDLNALRWQVDVDAAVKYVSGFCSAEPSC